MKKIEQRRVEVCAHWVGLDQPILMGTLYATPGRGKETFSFDYSSQWLQGQQARVLDPVLGLFKGPQYVNNGQNNFGIFLDSSPDRWGRVLMQRREAQEARVQNRIPQVLYELDYLLGVYDGNRIGALRFRRNSVSPFLDDNQIQAAPPWTSLRALENASLQLEEEGAEKNSEYSKWLKLLMAPGSSLGGARPKASVIDEQGHLWIAKFPSAYDSIDVGAWELVAHQLAEMAGIWVPQASARCMGTRHHIFLVKRFDRLDNGERLHFGSAMTLLNHIDGDASSTGASYLEFVEFLAKEGAQASVDLAQLWRRIVFFICISNTDDHLRNHGFILNSKGWMLSPAYDMNPVAMGNGLHLNISELDNAQDLDLVLSVIEYFRLKKSQAEQIIAEVVSVVKTWRSIASSIGITESEQDRMSRAFRVAEDWKARGVS